MPKSVRAKLNILAKARTIPTGSTTLTKLTLCLRAGASAVKKKECLPKGVAENNNCKSIIVYGGGARLNLHTAE